MLLNWGYIITGAGAGGDESGELSAPSEARDLSLLSTVFTRRVTEVRLGDMSGELGAETGLGGGIDGPLGEVIS